MVDNAVMGLSGRKSQGLLRSEDHGFRPSDPKLRLEDMNRDGIYTHVIYGPPTGLPIEDPELRTMCLRAYNDWAAAFNGEDPNRLVVLAMLPGHDPALAAEELRRVASDGHRGALVGLHEHEAPLFEDPWEEFWGTAEDVGIPIHFHLGGGLARLQSRPNSWRHAAMVSIIPMQLDEALVGMIFSGLLERYPSVKVVLGESGLGWIPYVLERMDHEYEKYFDLTQDVRLSEPPSFYFHRQVFATYEEDPFGLEVMPHIGASNVMWASDFPHGDSTWPNSLKAISESGLSLLSPEDRQRILWDNAADLYRIA